MARTRSDLRRSRRSGVTSSSRPSPIGEGAGRSERDDPLPLRPAEGDFIERSQHVSVGHRRPIGGGELRHNHRLRREDEATLSVILQALADDVVDPQSSSKKAPGWCVIVGSGNRNCSELVVGATRKLDDQVGSAGGRIDEDDLAEFGLRAQRQSNGDDQIAGRLDEIGLHVAVNGQPEALGHELLECAGRAVSSIGEQRRVQGERHQPVIQGRQLGVQVFVVGIVLVGEVEQLVAVLGKRSRNRNQAEQSRHPSEHLRVVEWGGAQCRKGREIGPRLGIVASAGRLQPVGYGDRIEQLPTAIDHRRRWERLASWGQPSAPHRDNWAFHPRKERDVGQADQQRRRVGGCGHPDHGPFLRRTPATLGTQRALSNAMTDNPPYQY